MPSQSFTPTLGFNAGKPPEELVPGETPSSQNVIVKDRAITQRSGLSQFGSSALGANVIGGGFGFSIDGRVHAVAASHRTIGYLGPGSEAYSALTIAGNPLSGTTTDPWDVEQVYDGGNDQRLLILTNGRQLPKQVVMGPSPATEASDLNAASDLLVAANSVTEFDNRIVWFNVVGADGVRRPNRVVWSARGSTSHLLVDGAGFQELQEMRGIGRKVIGADDGLALFSDDEIWRGHPTGGPFTFEFFAVEKSLGCPFPKTVQRTPFGIVFLGDDKEVWLLSGTQLRPLGLRQGERESRVQQFIDDNISQEFNAWAAYDREEKIYHFFFIDADGKLAADRALYYHFEDDAWFEQTFDGPDLSFGFIGVDPSEANPGLTWDEAVGTWDEQVGSWDQVNEDTVPPPPAFWGFSSVGTAYRVRSDQRTDSGTTIDARWRSHVLSSTTRGSGLRYELVNELWFDHSAMTASNMSVFFTGNGGATFDSGRSASLASSHLSQTFVPVIHSSRRPQAEVRWNDGGQHKLSRFKIRTRPGGQF